jgi:NADPH2:quinone reductase
MTVPSASNLMQAAVLESHGQPLRLASLSRPQPGPGQVLVRLHASAVNPLDVKISEGAAAHARQPAPAVLGVDGAGVVEAVGEGVTAFRRGDEVMGMMGGVGGLQGTLAGFVAVKAELLGPKPANLSWREAAALPLVFITAWEGLVDRAHVQAGQKVLVHGGGSGVGYVAIQIAKAFGAEVYATDSEPKRSAIEQLGAVFIDRNEAVEAFVARHTGGQGFDLVYDTAGGAALDNGFKSVRRFGHVVSCLGWGVHALAPLSFKAASYSGVFTLEPLLTGVGGEHHGEILLEAARLAEAGQVAPLVDARRFTLESVGEAYGLIRDRGARGKLVVEIGEGPWA